MAIVTPTELRELADRNSASLPAEYTAFAKTARELIRPALYNTLALDRDTARALDRALAFAFALDSDRARELDTTARTHNKILTTANAFDRSDGGLPLFASVALWDMTASIIYVLLGVPYDFDPAPVGCPRKRYRLVLESVVVSVGVSVLVWGEVAQR